MQQQLPSAVPGNAVPTVHHLATRFGPAAESFPPPTSDFWLPLNFLGYDAFPFIIVALLIRELLFCRRLHSEGRFSSPVPPPTPGEEALLLVEAPANHFTHPPSPAHHICKAAYPHTAGQRSEGGFLRFVAILWSYLSMKTKILNVLRGPMFYI